MSYSIERKVNNSKYNLPEVKESLAITIEIINPYKLGDFMFKN